MGFRSVNFKNEIDIRKFAQHYSYIKAINVNNTLDNNIKKLTSELVVATNGRTYEVSKIKNAEPNQVKNLPVFFLTKSGQRKSLWDVQREHCYDELIHNKPLADQLCKLNYKPGKLLFITTIDIICPITHSVITQPIITKREDSYEYYAIHCWLQNNKKHPVLTSESLTEKEIFINRTLQDLVSVSYSYRQHLQEGNHFNESEINILNDESKELTKNILEIQKFYIHLLADLQESENLSSSEQLYLISLSSHDLVFSFNDKKLIHILNKLSNIHKPSAFEESLQLIDQWIKDKEDQLNNYIAFINQIVQNFLTIPAIAPVIQVLNQLYQMMMSPNAPISASFVTIQLLQSMPRIMVQLAQRQQMPLQQGMLNPFLINLLAIFTYSPMINNLAISSSFNQRENAALREKEILKECLEKSEGMRNLEHFKKSLKFTLLGNSTHPVSKQETEVKTAIKGYNSKN